MLKTCTSIYKIVDKNISLVKVEEKKGGGGRGEGRGGEGKGGERDPGETGGC